LWVLIGFSFYGKAAEKKLIDSVQPRGEFLLKIIELFDTGILFSVGIFVLA
jgi:hypothetical protein